MASHFYMECGKLAMAAGFSFPEKWGSVALAMGDRASVPLAHGFPLLEGMQEVGNALCLSLHEKC